MTAPHPDGLSARCENCRWWVQGSHWFKSTCHRFPPVTARSEMAGFPVASATDFCGEHRPREGAQST